MVCEFSIQNFCLTAICHWIVNIGLRLLIFKQFLPAGPEWYLGPRQPGCLLQNMWFSERGRFWCSTLWPASCSDLEPAVSHSSGQTSYNGVKGEKLQHFLIIWIWPSSSFDEHLNAWFLRKGLHWKKSKPAQRNWICCGGISLLLITGSKENEPWALRTLILKIPSSWSSGSSMATN